MVYPNWEAAAAKSHAHRAVSTRIKRPTPRGELSAVIVVGPRIQAHYAYASSDGIAISVAYGRPSARDVDAIREWRVG